MSDALLAVARSPRPGATTDLAPAEAADQILRFMDRWICDRGFREDLLIDARAAAASRGFRFDPEELRLFWDEEFRAGVEELPPAEALRKVTSLGLIWIELRQRSEELRKKARKECAPADPRFAAWRQRQIARCDRVFHPRYADYIPHIPFAIELAKGCSVGCWFCGVSAPRLDGLYPYSDENAESFRKILKALAQVSGRPAGKWGILYWATDPFDHPDYEHFCADFAGEFGIFPPTTTALGWKDLARTRNLIRHAREDAPARVRLSILNLRILERYLSEFSPAELSRVSFQAVNKESVIPTSETGRARQSRPRSWQLIDDLRSSETSIACMSGFLINLVEKTVRLISPCSSDDRWPDGYVVYDERKYARADEFHALLEDMIDRNMGALPQGEQAPLE